MNPKLNLYKIYIISFMDLLAIGLIYPLLHPHVRLLGASHFTVGILGSSYAAMQVVSGPVIGSWSDIRGRKFVLIITLLLSSLCYVFLGLTSSVFVIFFIRVILGFVKHTQTICKAFIADLLPRDKHAEAYGQSTGLGMLGFVIGPVIGGHIYELSNGFLYVCCLTSLLFVINIVLVFNIPDIQRKSTSTENGFKSIFGNIHKELAKAFGDLTKVNWKVYWEAFSLRFLFALTVSIYHSSHSMYLQETHNLSQRYIGYTISFLSIVGATSGLSLGTITRKFYKDDNNCLKRMSHCFSVLCVCFVGFYLVSDFYTYLMLLIPFSISTSILRIVSTELLISKSTSDEKGSLSGASNSVMSIARFITPLSSGIIGDVFGENSVMFSAVVPCLVATLLCLKLRNSTKTKSE